MGQYYRAVVLHNEKDTPKSAFVSYDYDNGAKLMEHSYIGNYFVLGVEKHLMDNPCRLVWAGDYADEEPNIIIEGNKANLYMMSDEEQGCQIIKPVVNENITDNETVAVDLLRSIVEEGETFVINHTKKCYYQRPKFTTEKLVINPLPLLTCEGNSRGGGDYYGTNEKSIGTWSRDVISLSHTRPTDMKEIKFPNFKVNW